MKPEAKAKFAKIVDIVHNKEFWRTAKCLVELSAPAMNLLRLADSNIPGTGKVYHEMFKTEKLLETMSVEYDFIPKATRDAVRAKWMQRWTDLQNPLHGAGYCLDPEFHSHDHSACAEALKDLFLMCDKVHGTGSAASGTGSAASASSLAGRMIYIYIHIYIYIYLRLRPGPRRSWTHASLRLIF